MVKDKMTCDEFKYCIRELLGLNFECFEWEGILEFVKIAFDYLEKDELKLGFDDLADQHRQISIRIYNYLMSRGYYTF